MEGNFFLVIKVFRFTQLIEEFFYFRFDPGLDGIHHIAGKCRRGDPAHQAMVVVVRQQAVAYHGALEIAPFVFGWTSGCELPIVEIRGQGLAFPAGHDVLHARDDPGLPGFVPHQLPTLGQCQALGYGVFHVCPGIGVKNFLNGW